MVKCLVKIKTKVSVHLRLINHCCREVRVRVLALGPRLLARALGALPLLPALPGPDVGHGHAPGEAVGLGVRGGPTATAPGGAGCGSGCGERLVAPLMGRYYPVLGLVPALCRFPSCLCRSHGARRWQGSWAGGGTALIEWWSHRGCSRSSEGLCVLCVPQGAAVGVGGCRFLRCA